MSEHTEFDDDLTEDEYQRAEDAFGATRARRDAVTTIRWSRESPDRPRQASSTSGTCTTSSQRPGPRSAALAEQHQALLLPDHRHFQPTDIRNARVLAQRIDRELTRDQNAEARKARDTFAEPGR